MFQFQSIEHFCDLFPFFCFNSKHSYLDYGIDMLYACGVQFQGQTVLVGVDDMDLFKGIELKLMAVERVLDHHPEWRGKLVLIQVTNAPRLVNLVAICSCCLPGFTTCIHAGSALCTALHCIARPIIPQPSACIKLLFGFTPSTWTPSS